MERGNWWNILYILLMTDGLRQQLFPKFINSAAFSNMMTSGGLFVFAC